MSCGIHKGHGTKESQRRLLAFGWHDSAEFTVDTTAIVDGRNSARTYGAAVPRFDWDFERRIGPDSDREFVGRFMRSSKEAMVRRYKMKVAVERANVAVPFIIKRHVVLFFCDMLTPLFPFFYLPSIAHFVAAQIIKSVGNAKSKFF